MISERTANALLPITGATGEARAIMSELRSVIDGFRSESLPELPDARIEEDFEELHEAIERLETERLRRLAEIDRRHLYARDGFLSSAAWLASRHGLAWGAARGSVRVARALEQMPETRRALTDGSVSLSAVRVLADAYHSDPTAFREVESQLVEAARIHRVVDLQRVVARWRQGVERALALDEDDGLRARRRLHASVSLLGMVRIDGDFDPETGETLLAAFGAMVDAGSRAGGEDERTPAQWRADALGEICRQRLDRADRPVVAGERPHVTVTVEAGALRDPATGVGELDRAGWLPPQAVRRLACDASITRVVTEGRSEPLDVGRRTPVVPPSIRRAVIVRDRRCRFPGCDRLHGWCDAHHVVHWADGGSTSLKNLLRLCRRHHRMVHERGGFRLEIREGRPVFRRPDGSVLVERAPPPDPGP